MFASLIPAALQLGTSLWQLSEAGQLKNQARPKYEIPQAMEDAYNKSKILAAQRKLPGQDLIEGQLRNNTASAINSINQMGGGAAGMGAALQAFGNENNALTNLNIDAAKRYDTNQNNLIGLSQKFAEYQDRVWDMNKYQPYMKDMIDAENMTNAALGNMGNSANSAGSGIDDMIKMFGLGG